MALHFEVKLGNLNWHPIVLPDVLAVLEVCTPLGLTVSLDGSRATRSMIITSMGSTSEAPSP